MFLSRVLLPLLFLICAPEVALGTDYFVHPTHGQDTHHGSSRQQAFRTLQRASRVALLPGDRLLLASGETYYGELRLIGQHGRPDQPICITSVDWDPQVELSPALIDCKSQANGILLVGCSNIQISHLQITGNGYHPDSIPNYPMRCGVLISSKTDQPVHNITLQDLSIFEVFFENEGFTRDKEEVKTANGTQRYGWGIRVINTSSRSYITSLRIENCVVQQVSHTGIKFTGKAQNIGDVSISGNEVRQTGGPGIQMSEVHDVHVTHNRISYSGSHDDSRKWGRGSGLWTWGSSRVLIEKNSFSHANGPADSAGAHIDFDCDHIILQYNLSAYNAGGFCEVLGNTYNCVYRYNVSVNDGYRIKGESGAFQEGKTLWLSGYQGQSKARKGPVNFYFYNNTIFCADSLVAKIAIDNTSSGILIANNLFYLQGGAQAVLGDQYKPDTENHGQANKVRFQHNVFLDPASWPENLTIRDDHPRYGDPRFEKEGGSQVQDYRPRNVSLLKHKGIRIRLLPEDNAALWRPLQLEKDILGNPVGRKPSIGAMEPFK